ncbi:hypothetical protein [Vibrio sagamiensis]|uniref:Lipoprotein n=1 Tax=Vibrio sagamiensis NBRC 104589 TaxID=1219064 RepID=A0A511QJ63_9VIBR|nr:hypothetical protein [Vibrio sagamiensis]PNQ57660.1 hypothetical protein C1141_13560 [Vibrio agarivorans]GEM77321.1 hypothetical protein VSA01S_34330 [Vibrio sagamiensis NBRC 104589]
MKILFAILMGLVLTACGGDGGSSGSTAPPVSITPETQPEVTMTDLVIPVDFDFNPITESSLEIDISGLTTQRAHLSVYKTFTSDSDMGYVANYASKVASVPLDNGVANFDYIISDNQGEMLVEIWFYDGSEPIQKVISAGNSSVVM